MENSSDKPTPSGKDKPSLAVVLGSSGVRAFAALPFLQELDAMGIKADLVVGCGGGGLMAALWCAGYDMGQIVTFFTRYFTKEAYSQACSVDCGIMNGTADDDATPFKGVYNPRALREAYQTIFKDMRLEELSTKTLLYAMDIQNGQGLCLEKGAIAQAVEACGAYYPFMPPVSWEGRLLADAGAVSPLPVMEAVKRDVDLILAICLEDSGVFIPKNFLESAMHIKNIYTRSLRRAQLFSSIDMHTYEMCIAEVKLAHPVMSWDVHHIPSILHAAKMKAKEILPEFLHFRESFSRGKTASFKFHKKGDAEQPAAEAGEPDAPKKPE